MLKILRKKKKKFPSRPTEITRNNGELGISKHKPGWKFRRFRGFVERSIKGRNQKSAISNSFVSLIAATIRLASIFAIRFRRGQSHLNLNNAPSTPVAAETAIRGQEGAPGYLHFAIPLCIDRF